MTAFYISGKDRSWQGIPLEGAHGPQESTLRILDEHPPCCCGPLPSEDFLFHGDSDAVCIHVRWPFQDVIGVERFLDNGLKGDSQRGCGEPCRLLGRGEGALVHHLEVLVKGPLSNLSEGLDRPL